MSDPVRPRLTRAAFTRKRRAKGECRSGFNGLAVDDELCILDLQKLHRSTGAENPPYPISHPVIRRLRRTRRAVVSEAASQIDRLPDVAALTAVMAEDPLVDPRSRWHLGTTKASPSSATSPTLCHDISTRTFTVASLSDQPIQFH